MYHIIGGIVVGINASVDELENQGRLLAQIRRELGTSRELINRIYQNSTSAERLAAAPPLMHPLEENEPSASALNLGEADRASFLGRTQSRRSVGELITFGSVRSVRGPCSLPINNSFASTRM